MHNRNTTALVGRALPRVLATLVLGALAAGPLVGCRAASMFTRNVRGRYTSREHGFRVRLPDSAKWEVMEDPEHGAVLFRNPKAGLHIAVQRRKVRRPVPLTIRSRELLLGFHRNQVLSRQPKRVGGRPAVCMEALAEMDGRKVRLRTCVLEAFGYVYDLACWRTRRPGQSGLGAFDEFLAGFKPLRSASR